MPVGKCSSYMKAWALPFLTIALKSENCLALPGGAEQKCMNNSERISNGLYSASVLVQSLCFVRLSHWWKEWLVELMMIRLVGWWRFYRDCLLLCAKLQTSFGPDELMARDWTFWWRLHRDWRGGRKTNTQGGFYAKTRSIWRVNDIRELK